MQANEKENVSTSFQTYWIWGHINLQQPSEISQTDVASAFIWRHDVGGNILQSCIQVKWENSEEGKLRPLMMVLQVSRLQLLSTTILLPSLLPHAGVLRFHHC